jgi:hypothetical protein
MAKKMRDAATGKSKAERALGEDAPTTKKMKAGKTNKPIAPKKGAKPARNQNTEKRVISNGGIYNGPRGGSYGRYQVAQAATDILKKGHK